MATTTKQVFLVTRTRIIGTDTVLYSAWERATMHSGHRTIRSRSGGGWWGLVGSDWSQMAARRGMTIGERYELAYRVIEQAFPEAARGLRSAGRIDLGGVPAGLANDESEVTL